MRLMGTFLILVFLTGCANITVLRTQEIERITAQERDSVVHVYEERMDSLERQNRRDQVALNDVLRRLEAKIDRMANNLNESNMKMSAIAEQTGVITKHWEERARRDSLEAAIAENERRALIRQGVEAFRSGDFDLALEDFELYRETYPESDDAVRAYYKSAESLFHLEEYEAAEELLKEFFNEHRESEYAPRALFRLGQTYEKRGEEQRSSFVFDQLRDLFPESDAAQRLNEDGE
ncbi:tol-pal system protein YbgF [Chitinivibrio alkaliphilus ACht1]|uniref:Tol-pal system protein YbgF n=1 Tax=Chitinivibrio alkaliphilus ACht1 TaxID=1313304 RepID=U7DDX5_9BACT|nr:tol-pal system protein YbgF [Chitinivibrio alkaliphilus ACht1]